MANRYWVGNGGDWTSSSTTHWSSSSGGSGGASVPTANDDVYFDANSFSTSGNYVYIYSGTTCKNLICTGVMSTNTLIVRGIPDIKGNFTGSAGVIFYGTFNLRAASGNLNIDLANTAQNDLTFLITAGSAAVYTLSNAITTIGGITVYNGIFNTNNNELRAKSCYFFNNTNSGYPLIDTERIEVNGGTSKIVSSDFRTAATSSSVILSLSSCDFEMIFNSENIFWLCGENTNSLNVHNVVFKSHAQAVLLQGQTTFSSLTIEASPSGDRNIFFPSAKTQTVTNSFICDGIIGKYIYLQSSSGTWTLSSSSGTKRVNYTKLKNSLVTGGATWLAINSTDNGNNTGWGFIYPSAPFFGTAF